METPEEGMDTKAVFSQVILGKREREREHGKER